MTPESGRLSLTVDGHVMSRWTNARVRRDLKDISGSFEVEYVDSGRVAQAIDPDLDPMPAFEIVDAGMSCSVALDGETVLTGWIDDVDVSWNWNHLRAVIRGRDKTGDLADCAAAVTEPSEWRNQTALQIAEAIAAPFGIKVKADVDVGAAFPVFGINIEETALIAIEKAARQRSLLVVSDGVGGLLLTVGGSTQAPAALTRPGNIQGGSRKQNWRERYSDYYVKGQANKQQQRALEDAAMTDATDPITEPLSPPTLDAYQREAASIVMTGHAIDPSVKRWRPNVRGVRTQSGSSSVQAQAEWALRIARGQSEELAYTVLDWRAGSGNALWLPNQVARVSDAYGDINRQMLISGVTYRMSGQGVMTEVRLAGRTAFDRIDEPKQSRRYIFHRHPRSFGPTPHG